MKIHTVKWGDYIAKIAYDYGVPSYALIRANPQIPDPNKIYPGEFVFIPATWGPPIVMLPPPPKKVPIPHPPLVPNFRNVGTYPHLPPTAPMEMQTVMNVKKSKAR